MSVRFYRWNYSWNQIRDLYIQKQKEIADRTNAFCEFLVELTTAAFGGKSSDEGEILIDDGEGMDDISDDDLRAMREMLGDHDFYLQYPQMRDVI